MKPKLTKASDRYLREECGVGAGVLVIKTEPHTVSYISVYVDLVGQLRNYATGNIAMDDLPALIDEEESTHSREVS